MIMNDVIMVIKWVVIKKLIISIKVLLIITIRAIIVFLIKLILPFPFLYIFTLTYKVLWVFICIFHKHHHCL